MMALPNLTLHQKIRWMVFGVCLVTLTLFFIGILTAEYRRLRKDSLAQLETLANIAASNSTAALSFSDAKAATEVLGSLKYMEHLTAACLYDRHGELFASYTSHTSVYCPRHPAHGVQWQGSDVLLSRPVKVGHASIGAICLLFDFSSITERLGYYAGFSGLLFGSCFLVAVLLSTPLQRWISRPVRQLAAIARRVSESKDYSLRTQPAQRDEVGDLAQAFNEMLEAIETRDSQLQELNQDLVLARDRAQELARTKSEFLANMSHEIRTPINGILGLSQLALDTTLNYEQEEYLKGIAFSADSLLTVINDVLDFSKAEAGKMVLLESDFSISDLVEKSLRVLAVKAHSKHIELISYIDPGVPDLMFGDAARLRQVLLNLIGNAVKFTDKGEVVVRVRRKRSSHSKITTEVEVSDTGIGIAPEKQEAIFEAFVQADGSFTRAYSGTGLGLAISRQLVTLMGGTIDVESTWGTGSRFTCSIQLEAARGVASTHETGCLTGIRVLVITANGTQRSIFRQQIEHEHAEVVTSGCAMSGLVVLREHAFINRPFHVVLLDLHMPEIDGSEIARRILEDPTHAGVQIVMLTSIDLQRDMQTCKAIGVQRYLVKPVNRSELLSMVAECGSSWTGRVLQKPLRQISDSAETAGSVLPLSILVAEDNRVNQLVATRMLERLGHAVTVVSDGQHALNAVERSCFDLVLMDIQMPLMDGFESTRRIRQIPGCSSLHIVALTANAMMEDKARCLEAGMDDYLSKPIQQNELNRVLRSLQGQLLDKSSALSTPADNSSFLRSK